MVIFITGISSGFGKAMAETLAGKGHAIYGISRRKAERVSGINHITADVTDVASVNSAVREIINSEGRVDVLINNAGIGIAGPIETTTMEDIRLQMETNFTGAFYSIQSVLPFMRNQKKGMIINITSIGGIMGLPFQGFYSASKFALEGLSESLRMELKPFNIKVITVRPGDFFTGFTSNRKYRMGIDLYNQQFRRTLDVIENDEKNGLNPAFLATRVSRIVEKKNPRNSYIIASAEQKLAVILKKLLPDYLFFKLIESHYKIKSARQNLSS